MASSFLGQPHHGKTLYADYAAAIPGAFIARADLSSAAHSLEILAATMNHAPAIPTSPANPHPDPIANLWFIRAAHLFAHAGGDPILTAKLLQLSKRILQDFVAGRCLAGVKMDDGGLLLTAPDQPPSLGLRLNALWYSALESTAADLKAIHDKGADHFERLAGRFRRAFAKSYWCDGHNAVCPPYGRTPESHGEIPDAEQLILTILPESPIPRTKQRQLLQLLRAKSLAANGRVLLDHPLHGRVESLLHQAWLAVGIVNTTDSPITVLNEVKAIIAPLQALAPTAATAGLPAYFKDSRPIPGLPPDALTTAEVLAALQKINAIT